MGTIQTDPTMQINLNQLDLLPAGAVHSKDLYRIKVFVARSGTPYRAL